MHIMYVDEAGDPGFPPTNESFGDHGPSKRYLRVGVVTHGWR